MNSLIPLEDILFVFGAWTLMVKTSECESLRPGGEIGLFNQELKNVGTARVNKYLSSRNPDISAIELSVISGGKDMKEIKFVAPI